MNNYKIKVNDGAESKEAQELFEQLGFKWAGDNPENGDWYSHLYAENSTCCYLSPYVWGGLGERFKELTLPQLRELVAQSKSTEQGLISGADALNDYSNAQVSYDFGNGEYKWHPLDQCGFSIPQILKGHNDAYDSFAAAKLVFRLKPRTIKLEIEIPAPFEPKVGEFFFALYPTAVGGYSKMHITDQKRMDDYAKLGAWRTEEEIKQVVAALRGIKG